MGRRGPILPIPAAIGLLLLLLPFSADASSTQPLRVGVPKSMPPFAFLDAGLRTPRGFCVDLIIMAGKLMKSPLEFYHYDENSYPASGERLDIVSFASGKQKPNSEYQLIDTGVRIQQNFFTSGSCLTVTCLKDLPGHRVVTEKGREEEIRALASPITVIEVPTPEKALEALNTGQADVYISPCTLTTLYLIQKHGFQNIKEVGLPIETSPLYVAVLKERVDLLADLSLALGKILESENYHLLRKKWLGRGVEVSGWIQYIRHILIALGGLAFILLVFAGWNFLLKRKVQQMTRELSHSEERYRDLIESSPEMIHIISADGKLRLTNHLAKKLLALEEMDLTGKSMSDLVVPEQQEEMRGFIRDLFERGTGEKEFLFQAGDGTAIPIEMIATTLGVSGQPPTIASCFSRDIRVRKQLEEGLIRSDRLAVLGQVSAGLAHEINNPLGIILGNAQELLAEPLDENSRRENLEVIVKNTFRAGRIVNDFLSFTRQGPPVKAPLNLLDLVEESLLFVHSKIKAKKLQLRKEMVTGELQVYGDESQLMQLMVNLLLNAMEVLKEGGEITVRVAVFESDAQPQVLIEVEDNGPGVKPSDLKKIFDPFFTTKETGFGLGLFISSTIVERHQGSIWAESAEGKGAVLKVLLPLLTQPAPASASGARHG
jgi:PAS domain S-box-containing protein